MDNGANPNVMDIVSQMLLHSNEAIVLLYVQDSKAPLHYATENGNFHIIQLLISKGNADINVLDKVQPASIVLHTFTIIIYVQDHKTPIFNAIRKGNYDVVQMLASHGARADILDKVMILFQILCFYNSRMINLHCTMHVVQVHHPMVLM